MSVTNCFYNYLSVVEAAGIEPASEKARHLKPTCVSDSYVFGSRLKNRQERRLT